MTTVDCALSGTYFVGYFSFNSYKWKFPKEAFQFRQLFTWEVSILLWYDAAPMDNQFPIFWNERCHAKSGTDYPETRRHISE